MSRKIRLAMFFIITIILLVISIIAFGKIRFVTSDNRIYIDYIFTGDLRVNGKVAYRGGGIIIGFIEKIAINPDGSIRVTVVITDENVVLPEGTRFTIQAVGFGLGEKYIMATPPILDTRGFDSIPKNSVVTGIDPISLEATLGDIGRDINAESINAIINNLELGIANLNKILEDKDGNIENSFDNIASITAELDLIMNEIENGNGTLGALLKDKEIAQDLKEIIKNAKIFSQKISDNPSVLLFSEKNIATNK